MNFKDAFKAMKKGRMAKRPSWGGYWYWDAEKETVMMQCRPKDTDKGQGDLLDIERHRELSIHCLTSYPMNGLWQIQRTVLCLVEWLHLTLGMLLNI